MNENSSFIAATTRYV